MIQVERTIYFYELSLSYDKNNILSTEQKMVKLFNSITKLGSEKKGMRYQYFGEKYVYIQSIQIDIVEKYIIGKMRCIRKDVLPEIMNMDDDDVRGIETKESEGIVETTHFVIDYAKKIPILSIEYNQFGAKTQDFLLYLVHIGKTQGLLDDIQWRPVVRDSLKGFQDRMGLLSEFVVKVHKDNVAQIKNVSNQLWSALDATLEHFKSEYATLILKFDYMQKAESKEAESIIQELINKLSNKKENTLLFNILTVKAEDTEKNNLLGTFDLLIDRVKSQIKVERKEKYKTILSEDIFTKMKKELLKLSIRK